MTQKTTKEGQEIFDLKPLTEEEIAWLEEHFIDFAREQYLVRWDELVDMRDVFKRLHDIQNNARRNYRGSKNG